MSRTNVVVHRGRRTVGFLEAPGDRSLCPLAVLSPRAREHPGPLLGPLLGPIPLPRRSRASSGRVATTAHTIRRADASTVYLRDWRRPRAVPRPIFRPRTAPSAPQDTPSTRTGASSGCGHQVPSTNIGAWDAGTPAWPNHSCLPIASMAISAAKVAAQRQTYPAMNQGHPNADPWVAPIGTSGRTEADA